MRLAPWADALYACDYAWWATNLTDWAEFRGVKFTWCELAAREFGLCHVPSRKAPGLGRDRVHTGGNSGYQAVNLAYLLGAARIVLLGFDMQKSGGRSHWHGDHRRLNNPTPDLLRRWVENFEALAGELQAEGVEVINCSRQTALRCFPRATLCSVI